MIGAAYLEYYRGNLAKSEQIFQTVVNMNPRYTDAVNGLRRVQSIRRQTAATTYAPAPTTTPAPVRTVRPAPTRSCPNGYSLGRDGRCTRAIVRYSELSR